MDDLETCECGKCDWEEDRRGDVECRHCGTGPAVDVFKRERVHVARKDHGRDIKKGDTYRCRTFRSYFPGGKWGPWWSEKTRTAKGPAWAEAA